MSSPDDREPHDYLRRLPPERYRGQVSIHWSMTMDDRRTDWLIPTFYYKFREILTHTMFRYGLCCPIYCCMPDHIHLLWSSLFDGCDQRPAAKFFRAQLNPILEKLGARFQSQPYDHVLREEERVPSAFENVVDYIARNPERAQLVPADKIHEYKFTGCLIPGYPDVNPWQDDYWDFYWRITAALQKDGLTRNYPSGS